MNLPNGPISLSDILVAGKPRGARDDPHGAVLKFLGLALHPDIGVEAIERRIGYILMRPGPSLPGFGMEDFGQIVGSFLDGADEEDEDFGALGIPNFATGQCFVVTCEGAVHFDPVMYDRDEMRGWLSLAVTKFMKISPGLAPGLARLKDDLFEKDEELDALLRRLDGSAPWAEGPVGFKFSDQDHERWHSAHVPGFASTYL